MPDSGGTLGSNDTVQILLTAIQNLQTQQTEEFRKINGRLEKMVTKDTYETAMHHMQERLRDVYAEHISDINRLDNEIKSDRVDMHNMKTELQKEIAESAAKQQASTRWGIGLGVTAVTVILGLLYFLLNYLGG